MRTFTFEETFDLRNPVTLTEEQAKVLDEMTCGVSGEAIGPGDALVKVLVPSQEEPEELPDGSIGMPYNKIIAKVERLREKDWRYFRGETPRVALPEEID